jgi:hypothetical protein
LTGFASSAIHSTANGSAFYSVRVIDGFEVTRDNVRGALPALFDQAGLEDAEERQRLRTALGTIALYSARRPETR